MPWPPQKSPTQPESHLTLSGLGSTCRDNKGQHHSSSRTGSPQKLTAAATMHASARQLQAHSHLYSAGKRPCCGQGAHMPRRTPGVLVLTGWLSLVVSSQTVAQLGPVTLLHTGTLYITSTSLAAAADQPVSSTAQLPACQPQDILKGTLADGSELYLEVVGLPAVNSTPTVAFEGVLYHLQPADATDTPWQLQPVDWVLQPSLDLVNALPGWAAAVQQQHARQQLPHQPLLLQSVANVYSAAALQAAVRQNPAPWRDGTGPNDPPIKGLQYQTLCAGEIEALLAGQRGVVMVQLWVGWDVSAPQPVHNCLVLHGLRQALSRKDISIFLSSAPGGLGLTAILAAQVEPFRSWGAHLASFGAQAALVADSPYYKLLIGRILGYAEPNIRHHIEATTGRPVAPEVSAAVDRDLRGLSKQKPKLPWAAAGPAASARARQQHQPAQQQAGQQLSRSARKKAKN